MFHLSHGQNPSRLTQDLGGSHHTFLFRLAAGETRRMRAATPQELISSRALSSAYYTAGVLCHMAELPANIPPRYRYHPDATMPLPRRLARRVNPYASTVATRRRNTSLRYLDRLHTVTEPHLLPIISISIMSIDTDRYEKAGRHPASPAITGQQ